MVVEFEVAVEFVVSRFHSQPVFEQLYYHQPLAAVEAVAEWLVCCPQQVAEVVVAPEV